MTNNRRRFWWANLLLGLVSSAGAASLSAAAAAFAVYNETTGTEFVGVYLAPENTENWGANQALNDKDHALDTSERLLLKDIGPRRYDVRLVDRKGRSCILKGVDLTRDRSFEVRDQDLTNCH
ncbi:MAG: hypothetical protein J2P47_04075 [Acetobacteraceae bacterium]|nr:hypothetical protein [Acetobacteraceae bacterium]